MKKLLLATVLLIATSNLIAQNISTFHRMLILNEQNELMVIKIKEYDVWVTPGLYQNDHLTIKEGLDSIASTYGLTLSNPELRGIFTLRSEVGDKKSLSTRNMFVLQTNERETKSPDLITEVKWLRIDEATQLLSFPHISSMAKHVIDNPGQVWAGTLLQQRENNLPTAEVIEDFYAISPSSN